MTSLTTIKALIFQLDIKKNTLFRLVYVIAACDEVPHNLAVFPPIFAILILWEHQLLTSGERTSFVAIFLLAKTVDDVL